MNDAANPAAAVIAPRSSAVLAKVAWRLLPFLCLLYVFNILDRTNAGFARLTMKPALEMERWEFDLCLGVFYLGYLAFEVPANLLLRRVGARRWMARIMISWGLVSCLTLAVTGPWTFGAVRVLLGIAEAGFFPGIILYLTEWFPARDRSRVMALFITAIPVATVIGSPTSGAVMEYCGGMGGLADWQWLFLIEGLPSIVLGIVVLFYLPDGPAQARWLTPAERDWLIAELSGEDQARQLRHGPDLWRRAMVNPRVWLLICIYFTVAVGANAYGAYSTEMLKTQFIGYNTFKIGLLGAIPPTCAIVVMLVLGTHSDRTGERRWHLAAAAWLAAAGWTLSYLDLGPWTTLAGFCVALSGMMSMLPLFWPLPAMFLSGAAAAAGIALINSVANLGGLMGPNILGAFGPEAMAVILCAGGVLTLWVRIDAPPGVAGAEGATHSPA